MSSVQIHPTAVVDKSVELDTNVSIGAFSVVKGNVRIGRGTKIESHVTVGSDSTVVQLGENNHLLPGAMIGGPPQDLSYKNEPTQLHVGNNNIFREFVTVNCGTAKGGGVTRIGNNCMLMSYVHIAHDCQLGNHVIIANGCQFAGHVTVEDYVRLGGMCGVVQFARIGKFAYIAGASHIRKDLIPFTIVEGSDSARPRATNKIGIQRAGFSKDEVDSVARAVRILVMGDRTIEEALTKIGDECQSNEHIQHLVSFIKASEAGIAR